MFKIVVATINFDNSELSIREKVHFTQSKKIECYDYIKNSGILMESVILSTCNRSEIYGVIAENGNANYIGNIFEYIFHLLPGEIVKYVEVKEEAEAINHIFEVAGGFKSMVIGEDQILGQVKSAYFEALEQHSSSKILNKLFLGAITFGKKFRSSTGISNIPTSISSLGVKLLKNKVGTLQGKRALVIGFGEMNKIILKYLMSESMDKIFIANRTLREVDLLKDTVEIIPFIDRYETIDKIDIIVSCTSAPHFVLKNDEFKRNYKGKKMIILDLALPRDVESTIAENSNIELFVIDDLKELSEESYKERSLIMKSSSELLVNEINRFKKWSKIYSIRLIDNSSVG